MNEISTASAFYASPRPCIKASSYFEVYDELFARFRGKPIVFVEVGVFAGGSLFMWREFFGRQARIIGIDLNPEAIQWRQEGFEIFIGDQADPAFWQSFREQVGDVDILLDDGGHTFSQQIVTVEAMLPAIRDGGLLVVEDTHSSYMPEFGGPSRRSFISYAKTLVDEINYRSPVLDKPAERGLPVRRVSFFESIVALHVDRATALAKAEILTNMALPAIEDCRYRGSAVAHLLPLAASLARFKHVPVVGRALLWGWRRVQSLANSARTARVQRYFP